MIHNPASSPLPIKTYHTSVLSSVVGESGITLESASDKARIVIVAGEPLDQEIVQHGPFVMGESQSTRRGGQRAKLTPVRLNSPVPDSRQGIQKAFMDYQMGANGFEGAHEWQSEIGKVVSRGKYLGVGLGRELTLARTQMR